VLKFDRVLCDVPCSGDGTLRKNYAIWEKWNVANGNNFNSIQMKILRRGLEMLKKGGRLVYSTCSFNPIEDEAIISNVIDQSEGGVELIDVSQTPLMKELKSMNGLESWIVMTREMKVMKTFEDVEERHLSQIRPNLFPPKNIKEYHMERTMRVLPHHQNTGGFFIAVLEKKVEQLAWEENEEKYCYENSEGTSGSTKAEQDASPKSPPRKKAKTKKFQSFKEDPYLFIDENDQDWLEIK
jgi:tRNA (cytosine34-C5)-methyltransferase